MKRYLSVAMLAAILLSSAAAQSAAAPRSLPHSQDPTIAGEDATSEPYRPGQVLVKFRPPMDQAEGASALASYGLPVIENLAELQVLRVGVAEGQEQSLVQMLLEDPRVEYAELDYMVHATIIPNDPGFNSYQWGLQKIQAPSAWDVTTGTSDVVIAIIDTGVDLNHPDLNNKIVPGWDFVNDDAYAQDDHGHGTHVAGIAAAESNNGQGGAGASWGARIMPLKVLDPQGDGYYSDVASAVRYACNHGAWIINLSLGGSNPSSVLEDALEDVYQDGCLVTAAAGNDGRSGIDYPARYPHAMAVAATNDADQRATFSDWGPEMDVAAPGVDIYSTLWTPPNNHTYGWKMGTSMSAPLVAGEAALIWSLCPQLTNVEVRGIVQSTATDRGPTGWDVYYGWGRINAYAAVQAAMLPPVLSVDREAMVFLADATTGPWPQNLLVSNAAPCGSLDWTAGDGVGWLDEDPASGEASAADPGESEVSVSTGGLTQGQTYNTTLTVSSSTPGVQQSPQLVAVKFVYSDTPLLRTMLPLSMHN
jgi:thermitase